MLRAALPPTHLAARPGAAAWRHLGAGPAHGDQHLAHRRAPPGAAGREIPPRAETRPPGRAGGRPGGARAAAGRLRAEGAGAAGPRRPHRAPARQVHRRQGDLPRPGPLLEGALRQGQRPALAQPDAAGPDPLGRPGLGTALPDHARPLRAVQPPAWPAAQDADRLGAAVGPAGPPLDAGAGPRAGGGQQLRRPRAPRRPGPAGRDLRHPPAARRRALPPGAAAPAPPRQPRTPGRPRTKGARLPTPAKVLADRATPWQRVTVPEWHGEGARGVEICSETAVWRHAGLPVVPIRWVLLRDPGRRFDPQALLCTDPAQEPLQIVRWFVQRWRLEVTFREVRDHLGVETQRQWSDRAIARTTPCLLGLFSVVTLL